MGKTKAYRVFGEVDELLHSTVRVGQHHALERFHSLLREFDRDVASQRNTRDHLIRLCSSDKTCDGEHVR